MNLQDIITEFGSSYTVTRTVPGSPTSGVYPAGSTSSLTIVANVQPVTGDLLEALAEGRHAEDTRLVYTKTELKTQSPGYAPDRIAIDGTAWEVFKVETHTAPGFGTHYVAWVSNLVVA